MQAEYAAVLGVWAAVDLFVCFSYFSFSGVIVLTAHYSDSTIYLKESHRITFIV